MASDSLINILLAHIGKPMTKELAADICIAADAISQLMPDEVFNHVKKKEYNGYLFNVELMEDVKNEIKPLHLAHWDETEAHRHDLPFNPDYQTFVRYEQANRYVLFTMRDAEWSLVGNCAMYLDRSAHTQTLIATEDTLYLLPKARRGRMAFKFVKYIEDTLTKMGVKEINISVKVVNKADRFFRLAGYRHVENGLIKILENENV